ncbi:MULTISPECIES: hypothetical protein [Prauserella salsuginis group]|uniref:Uncharacterized protein n=1 Tax=Prauserella salsuginis TaxID=387889 RepID=A0ABW6G010_9PSEU|nr:MULTISPECIES: hypothetical protein [Prauserella salsuginis group]
MLVEAGPDDGAGEDGACPPVAELHALTTTPTMTATTKRVVRW